MAQAVTEFQAFLTGLSNELNAQIERLGGRLSNLTQPELLAFVTDAYPALATPYLSASADATAVWYEDQPAPASSDKFVAKPADLSPAEQLAANARWAMLQMDPVVALQGSATRAVFDSSRNTVFDNAVREDVRWARHASPKACGFCRLLATRGAVYRTQARALRAHDHCHCLAVPDRDGNYEPPDYVQGWEQDYEAARRGGARTPAEIANAMDQMDAKRVPPTKAAPKPAAPVPPPKLPAKPLSEKLAAQKIPEGWEAIDSSIPDWINQAGQVKYKVQAENLNHAIRIPGTDHVLTSDVKLTDGQLQSLAEDYKAAVDLMGSKFPEGVAMHVPGGKGNPRSARGWVRDKPGVRTFYILPSVAKGADEARYQATLEVNEKLSGKAWHMPAVKKNGRQYTMMHEMGHLIDAQGNHTQSFGVLVGSGSEFTFWISQKAELSEYARANLSEGYAEAAAQYFLGGKGTSEAADNYAQRYGW